MKTYRNIISVILSLLLVISVFVFPISVSADSGTVIARTWSEIKAALEDGKDGTVVIKTPLTTEAPSSERVIINGGNKTLDIRDNVINISTTGDVAFCNLITINGGSLAIKGFSYLRYKYNISSDYASTEKDSAICYVNGGILSVENCELRCDSGACVKVNSGYADIGLGTTLTATGQWVLRDTPYGSGKISVSEDAYIGTIGGSGMCTQGANEGYGALRLDSENTELIVTAAKFNGGVQLKSVNQSKQFEYSSGKKTLTIGSDVIGYMLQSDRNDAVKMEHKYYWYTYTGDYYYLCEVSGGGNNPGEIAVEDSVQSVYNITVENGSASCYGGYQKSFQIRDTAAAGRELYLRADSSDLEFDKWIVTSGKASITAPAKESTTFIMGSGDVTIAALYKGASLDGKIFSAAITGVVEPKAGNMPSTAASVDDNADYEIYVEYGEPLVNWWNDNTMQTSAFESGKAYEVRVFLVPKEGKEFIENTSATINGKPAEAWLRGSSLLVSYTFPETGESDVESTTAQTEPVTETKPEPVPDYSYSDKGDHIEITAYNGTDKEVTIPSEIDGKPVTVIGLSAFEGRGITSVVIPESVKTIDDWAFGNCSSLESVVIKGAETIGDNAFAYCNNLENVQLPDTLKSVGYYAFASCPSLLSVTVPASVTNIGEGAFGENFDKVKGEFVKLEGFKIVAEKDSPAEKYASDNGFNFEEKSVTPETTTAPYKPTEAQETTTAPDKPTEPITVTPDTPTEPQETTAPVITAKKSNPVKVTAKTKTVKAKKVKKKKAVVKPLTIKNAQGTVKVTKVKKGTAAKIFKKITVNSKTGAITLKKGKYAKKTYKIKLKIVVKGNSKYKPKTLTKTVKIKVK